MLRDALGFSKDLLREQFEDWDRQRRASAELMRLGVATLAGVVAAAGIAAGAGVALGPRGYAGAAVAVTLQFAGVVFLARSSGAGFRPQELAQGSNPEALFRLVHEANITPVEFLASVLEAMAASFQDNRRALGHTARLRGVGFLLLVLGAVAFLATIVLIGGGLIVR